ncbi:MAG TPA: hypothetical protein VME46_25075 [Acidimicrobiales bacterium]|nr:hypothetical protein [Acidimicrobiales bacterium]
MPSVTVDRPVTLDQATEALRAQLDNRYTVTPRGGGRRETIGVKHALELANVRLVHDGGSTTFRVRGGGLIINRVVNELGIARKVRAALRDSLTGTYEPS